MPLPQHGPLEGVLQVFGRDLPCLVRGRDRAEIALSSLAAAAR
jgi:hypothetical protein